MSKDFGVAATHCYFCLEADKIVINTRLSPTHAAKVEELHGKVVDMEPCPKCKDWMSKGILLISVSNEAEKEIEALNARIARNKHDNDYVPEIPNPERTGGWTVVKDEAFERIFTEIAKDKTQVLHFIASVKKRRWAFLSDDVWCVIGLPRFSRGSIAKLQQAMHLYCADKEDVSEVLPVNTRVIVLHDSNFVRVATETGTHIGLVPQRLLKHTGNKTEVDETVLSAYDNAVNKYYPKGENAEQDPE